MRSDAVASFCERRSCAANCYCCCASAAFIEALVGRVTLATPTLRLDETICVCHDSRRAGFKLAVNRAMSRRSNDESNGR